MSSTPYIAPDTLRSAAFFTAVDVISEGEIQGLVDGLGSIYLNDTPIYDVDEEIDYFLGVTASFRKGVTAQELLTDQPSRRASAAEEYDYNQKVSSVEPQYFTIDNPDLTHLSVILSVPSLSITDTKGNVNVMSLPYSVWVRYEGGEWQKYSSAIVGKCSTDFQLTIDFTLPKNPLVPANEQGPWDIRVTKQVLDGQLPVWNGFLVANDFYVQSLIGYVNLPLNYPYTALCQLGINAVYFGSNIPVRTYLVYGIICNIPSNYDPWARIYTGIWDGTFTQAWTNNPAWVMYDLIVNDRYGLGMYVDPTQVDKWALYEIAQYCDELVPDGYGGLELRFAFNGTIGGQREAFDTLSALASTFRGMAYWASGSVTVSQDKPKDPVLLVTPSSVIDGNFSYKSSALKARHTAALVKWSDPLQHYKPDYEAVEDNVGINRYGYRSMSIEAVGCTTRGQARRFGLWAILTELVNTQTITYQAGLDHAVIMPGDIVQVQDPTLGASDFGGRLRPNCTTTRLVLDRLVGIDTSQSYICYTLNADGSVYEGEVAFFSRVLEFGATIDDTINDASMGDVIASPNDINASSQPAYTADNAHLSADNTTITADADDTPYLSVVNLTAPLLAAPAPGTIWVLQVVNTDPSLFQVVGKKEVAANIYEISAVEHTPALFAAVDNYFFFDPEDPPSPTTVPAPVTNIVATEEDYYDGNGYYAAAFLSWTAPDFNGVVNYHITGTGPGGFVDYGVTSGGSFTLKPLSPGAYTFQVASQNQSGASSTPATVSIVVVGWANVAAPVPTSLILNDQTAGDDLTATPMVFATPSPTIIWTNTFPDGVSPYPADNVVRVYHTATNTLLRTVQIPANSVDAGYTYTESLNKADGGPFRDLTFVVTAKNPNGVEGGSASLAVINPSPAAATGVQASVTMNYVAVSYDVGAGDLADFAGARIYLSSTAQFQGDPDTAAYVYSGNGDPAQFSCNAGTYYVFVALFDTFGIENLVLSAPVEITVNTNQVSMMTPTDYLASGQSLDLDNPPNSVATSEDLDDSPTSQNSNVDLDQA